jgi:ABC-2 type transport system ATP-binding protein
MNASAANTPVPSPAPALDIRDLRKTYDNGVEALKGVSLEVQPGDFYALLGPNGAGKSTLIGIVSSLVNKSSGDVRVFGVDIGADRDAAMRLIGLVPQEINFNMFEQPLDISTLRKTYDNGVEALKGVSLRVDEGDFFALLGPNGAGKSTLIGVVSSLVNPTSGHVEVFGVDLAARRSDAMRLIGLVPQEINFNMFEQPFDICVNYAGFYGIPRKQAEARAEEELKAAGLWGKARMMSRTLSGGMKRRLMIARAMMTRPRLLILDEPTAGVDIEIRRGMWKTLREVNAAGTTVILTTHYLEEAENLCRNLAIIDQGRIIEQGPMKALLAKLDVEGFEFDIDGVLPAMLPVLQDMKLEAPNDHTLTLEMPRSQDLNGVFAALSAAGIRVRSMRTQSNRLEELFVRLTGENKVALANAAAGSAA